MLDQPAYGSNPPDGLNGGEARGDHGSVLIPADRLSTLRDAACLAAGDDPLRQAQLVDAIERLAKPLAILQDLPGDAADALGGSGPALDRLTTALATLGGLSGATEQLSEAGAIKLQGRLR